MFGAVVSGRPYDLDGVEEMVGLFINTLPVRVKIAGQRNLRSLLQTLQSQQLDIGNYQYTSLSDIHRWSELPAHVPLFDSIIRFQNFPLDPSLRNDHSSSTDADVLSVDWWHYPLCIVVGTGLRLSLSASYKRSQFDTARVKELLEQFRDLLKDMAEALLVQQSATE